MDAGTKLDMAFNVLGGLGIFLLGMRYLSDGLQTIGGNRLRRLVSAVTNNRLLATGVGVVVTCLIQSSSITTVMVVGFVNSGIMTLTQAIGVIMGANIGTTITGWILVLKVGKYGLPILGAASFFHLFSKREFVRYAALVIMGLGMVFFGLELMKNGFKPIRSMPEFHDWFQRFSATSYLGVLKCVAAGCLLTMIVQSSSATLGITIGLASTGVVPFETAAALVLGENIGTTITALLASIGTTTNAKRAAYAHTVFNVLGVAWITAIFPVYLTFIQRFVVSDPNLVALRDGDPIYPNITAAIASVHTCFNVANTLLFLPFVRKLAALLNDIVPEKLKRERPHLTNLDVRMLQSPVIGIEQSRVEILRMAETARRMLEYLRKIVATRDPDDTLDRKILHREEVLDILQKEVTVFLTGLLAADVPLDVIEDGRSQLRIADEYESIGDYIRDIIKRLRRLASEGLDFKEEGWADILQLHEAVRECLGMVNGAYTERDPEAIAKVHSQGKLVKRKANHALDAHLARVSDQHIDPHASVIFADTIQSYRKLNAHLMNVAEAFAHEK